MRPVAGDRPSHDRRHSGALHLPRRDQCRPPLQEQLLDQRLAACINQLPGSPPSIAGRARRNEPGRSSLVIKSQPALFEPLRQCILAHHPYEVPEILALPRQARATPYLDWLTQETSRPPLAPSFLLMLLGLLCVLTTAPARASSQDLLGSLGIETQPRFLKVGSGLRPRERTTG